MEETGSISVTEPIGEAIEWTRERLFEPFDLGEWFVFGFAWFLATLAKFGGPSVNYSGSSGESRVSVDADTPADFVDQILGAVEVWHVIAGLIGLAVFIGLLALLLWIGSRGTFIFLDATLRDEAAITEPWSDYQRLGNSLFVVRLLYMLVTGVLTIVGPGIVLAVIALTAGLSAVMIPLLLVALLLGLPFFLALAIGYQMLADFVAPVMLQRDMRCWPACKRFWNEVLSRYPGTFLLFYLLKGLLWFGSVFLILIGGCLTCCIGFLPYLFNVVFLPIGVFFRTYTLRMLAQFGPEWAPAGGSDPVAELF